jgi:hypothetical protein
MGSVDGIYVNILERLLGQHGCPGNKLERSGYQQLNPTSIATSAKRGQPEVKVGVFVLAIPNLCSRITMISI